MDTSVCSRIMECNLLIFFYDDDDDDASSSCDLHGIAGPRLQGDNASIRRGFLLNKGTYRLMLTSPAYTHTHTQRAIPFRKVNVLVCFLRKGIQ